MLDNAGSVSYSNFLAGISRAAKNRAQMISLSVVGLQSKLLDNTVNNKCVGRTARLVDSPNLPEGEAIF